MWPEGGFLSHWLDSCVWGAAEVQAAGNGGGGGGKR